MADEWATEVVPPTEVLLPAGHGWTFVSDWRHPDFPNIPASTVVYVVEGEEVALSVLCTGKHRPDDDWLSIAETLEFLPAEE